MHRNFPAERRVHPDWNSDQWPGGRREWPTGIAGLSGALVDQLAIWGDAGTITARIGRYRQAGADHVMLHVLSEGGQPSPIEVARQLAGSLVS